jgi:hypothetical protein
MRSLLALLALFALVAPTAACSGPADQEGVDGEDELRKGSNADQWIYDGTLPHLESPAITVSLQAHTARVTGYLPAGYDAAQLPYYVDTLDEGGRTKIAIVYPIATGASVNSQPRDYQTERVYPHRTDSSAPWGGFPFISYNRGIAFHGPITATDGEWRLVRGPVSHGCNRMQGEHVVELAHLLGVDMSTKVYPPTKGQDVIFRDIKVPVRVLAGEPDTWKGKPVDVDYAATAAVKRPKGDVVTFKTWSADDLATFVCKLDKKKLDPQKPGQVPLGYCGGVLGLKDKIDARTGAPK